ncbi:uncharacterized protein LOC141686846 isoform X2 [Apium graveolens]
MDGGKGFTDNEQAGPKKQKVIRKEGMSREERLNLYIATCMDPSSIRPSLFGPDKDVDLSVPHMLTFREFASMCLDDIEHGNFDVEEDYSNIVDCGAVLRLYDPEANIKRGAEIDEIVECSVMAIGEYNKSNGTHFDFVSVLKANVEPLSPYRYYITFEAHDQTRDLTQFFQAMVTVGIPTTDASKREVELVQIRKPPQLFCGIEAPAAW